MISDRRLPPLRLLAVFEAVLRGGGIQRAAHEMNVSQPAISQAVRQLEEHVGVVLFDRRTRPATLTEAGRILQRAVSEGLGRIAEAIEQVRALHDGAEASLTIACTVGTATYWLMPSLTGFYERHGDIAVSVRTTAQGLPRLLPGVDMALRYGLGDWTDGTSRLLHRETVVPVCTPELHASLAGRSFDLATVPLLHVDADVSNWMEWHDYLARIGRPVPARAGRRFTNYVQATQAALAGLGVMLGWRSMVRGFLASGELMALPFPALMPEEAFYMVFPHRDRPAPDALPFLTDWLLATAAGQEDPVQET